MIDIGCGTRRFLRALERTGFRAAGVEVSESLVHLSTSSGLEAVQGLAPDFPWNGVDPVAITFFEILEHIPQARGGGATFKSAISKSHYFSQRPVAISSASFVLWGQGTF